MKKLETAFFVSIVNLESEKLQVSKIYMKSWPNYIRTYSMDNNTRYNVESQDSTMKLQFNQ